MRAAIGSVMGSFVRWPATPSQHHLKDLRDCRVEPDDPLLTGYGTTTHRYAASSSGTTRAFTWSAVNGLQM
jgi:hypothetical protein